jgi:hypothetical protein
MGEERERMGKRERWPERYGEHSLTICKIIGLMVTSIND